jgi:hypothetical protein
VEFEIAVDGPPAEAGALYQWLIPVEDVHVAMSARPPGAGEQGGWEVLSVACGSGGAAVATIHALRTWLQSRRSTVTVKVRTRQREVEVTASNVDDVLPVLEKVLRGA